MNRWLIGLILTFTVLAFQNCSWSPDDGAFQVSLKSSGNGEGYDGKLSTYRRFVPGFSCGNEVGDYASIQFIEDIPYLTKHSSNQCSAPVKISDSEIVRSKNSEKYIGYEEGVYKLSSFDYPDEVSKRSFVEAWCRSKDSNPDKIEIFIELDPVTKKSWGTAFDSRTGDEAFGSSEGTQLNFLKSIEPGRVRFEGAHGLYFAIEIQTSRRDQNNPFEFQAVFKKIYSQDPDIALSCRLGGQFDPVAPKLAYNEFSPFFIKGKQIRPITPTLNKKADYIEVSPALPEGLEIDPFGEIKGAPFVTANPQTYKISAHFLSGVISTSLNITVGEPYFVNERMSENPNCLRCALDKTLEDASQSPSPALVILPAGRINLSGTPIFLAGNIKLLGAGKDQTVLDGNSLSRVIEVQQKQSDIHLEGLSIVNGKADTYGAGIEMNYQNADGSNLTIKNAVIKNNSVVGTETGGDGGGISASNFGTLSIIDTTLENNQIVPTQNGIGASGGGVRAYFGRNVLIYNSSFNNNYATYSGGGLFLSSVGNVSVTKSSFKSNSSHLGGAAYIKGESAFINQSSFVHNISTYRGGAILLNTRSNSLVANSTFYNNWGWKGSAIFNDSNWYSVASIINSSFYFDSSAPPKSLRFPPTVESMIDGRNNSILIGNSIIQGYGSKRNCFHSTNEFNEDYKNLPHFASLGHNISNDQSCYLDHPNDLPETDALLDTFNAETSHILTPKFSSPAIGAGHPILCPEQDQVGTPRATGKACDIGAIEVE